MVHAVSLVVLAAVFATATALPVNMGVLAFVAAFGVGALSGVSLEEVLTFFPGDVFILVAGITLLFGVAKVNGTIDLVITASLQLVRGRRWAIAWVMFALAAILMSLGSVLAAAMLAPVAMPIAARYRIHPLLMGGMLLHGMLSTAFSPITVYGAFTTGVVANAGFDVSPVLLFAVPFGLNLLIAALLFGVLGRGLFRPAENPAVPPAPGGTGGPLATLAPAATRTEVTPMRVVTLTGMLALLVAGAAGVDVGVAAFVIGALLLLASPAAHQAGFDNVNWSAVVLVCGMLSYMAVLKENGTLAMLGDAAASLGSPLFAALLLCFAVGVVSAFGSSIGTLGIALPLAFPLLEQGDLSVAGVVVALAFCSTVVDVSPFSTNGIIILAQAQVPDKVRFQRQMLAYCGSVVVLAPLLAWTLAVVPF
ncbi:SLC13 family permease [Amycolatopsis albispora]|uniref:C4-dicarboxylate ABC transporter n=1 Tax=Amycolatopsis albispora TaxID=1804986 RepID=A0A344L5Q9_9PSEU|nr:SLC13 family permease [Amycolatopsis albispora]AXB43383.1 C4-dicarboxylate ABC transporter [Amycolatopsis albispora]